MTESTDRIGERWRCWLHRMVRRWSRFAWEEMLFDVGRVEWKFGRTDDGKPKNWTEWNNVRVHLREAGKLRQPQELESPNGDYPPNQPHIA